MAISIGRLRTTDLLEGMRQGLRLAAVGGALGLIAGCAESIVIDQSPPPSIADLHAEVDMAVVRLAWTEPGEAGLAASLIARFPASGVVGRPDTARAYAVGDSLGNGVVLFYGRGTELVDQAPCTQQIYAGWAQDGAGNWSLFPETLRVTGVGGALPPAPSGLAATVTGSQIALSWTPAADPRAASVRIVRNRSRRPANVSDGETVFTGSGGSISDASAELSPVVTWRYAAFSCNPCAECESAGSHVELSPTLMQSLRAGGFVVYWRHGTATTCTDKQELGFASNAVIPEWWKSCNRNCTTAVARQLDDPRGIQEAQTIGQALRQRSIPFSRVMSSEYCRCRETAQHMNLGPAIETSPQVTFFVYPEIEPCAAVRVQLATAPAAGTNTAIVAHVHPQCILENGPDLTLDNGQAAIYRPDGMGGTTLIAKVRYNEWSALP